MTAPLPAPSVGRVGGQVRIEQLLSTEIREGGVLTTPARTGDIRCAARIARAIAVINIWLRRGGIPGVAIVG